MDKLTGMEYMTKDATELRMHPEFSPHAFRVILAISKMSTEEIEQINLIEGKNDGRRKSRR